MRRKRASATQPVHWRSGVMVSVRHRKRSVQSPSERISASAGLGPSVLRTTPLTSHVSGSSASTNSTGLAAGCCSRLRAEVTWPARLRRTSSESMPAYIDAHLGFVAVEHQRRALLREQVALADAALGGLAPARVVDLRVDVGVEAVLLGRARSTSWWPAAARRSGSCTMDFALLKPYFHGTTSRTGAPFWLGSAWPYRPKASIDSGCIASSMRSAFDIRPLQHRRAQARHLRRDRPASTNCTNLALPVGSTRRISSDSE